MIFEIKSMAKFNSNKEVKHIFVCIVTSFSNPNKISSFLECEFLLFNYKIEFIFAKKK